MKLLFTTIKLAVFALFISFTITFNSHGDVKYQINSVLDLSIADVIKVPTETIIILNTITANEHLQIEDHNLQSLKNKVNIEHSTDVLKSVPILLKNKNVLNISNNDILPVLNNFIRYHNDIFGQLTDEVYYELAKSIKSGNDTNLDIILYNIFHEWLMNTKKEKKSNVANLIAEFLPVSKISNTMGILSSLSIMIEQQQLFTIINKIKNDHPDNDELINQMEHLKSNILHPDQSKRAKIIY